MEPDDIAVSEAAEAPTAQAIQRRIKRYDFTRPDKFSKDQILTMAIMHETYARHTTTALSALLRSLAHVHVASVDQLTYEEFIRSIPNPCTMAIVSMEPLKGSAVLEIDPALSSSIIDRLFGGQGRAATLTRELTDIESSAMESIIARILGNLREAWSAVTDLRPRLAGLETNPLFAQIVPPSEMIVLVTMEGKIGDAEGMINFCIPYLTIEPIIPRLSRQYIWSHLRSRQREGRFPAVSSLPVMAEISYEGERLALSALSHLKRGALIGMPRYGEGIAFLQAGGAPFLQLSAQRSRDARRATYALTEHRLGKDLDILGAVGKATKEKKEDTLQDALRSFSAEVGAAMKSIEGKITDLSHKQEELADQLIFESPDREIASGGHKAGQKRAFSSSTVSDCAVLATFIGQEHPQLIAMVISHLEPGLAACVLEKIPENLRTDIMERICTIDRISPEVLRDVERVLEQMLSVLSSQEYAAVGGVQSAVEILNVASRSLEKGVVDTLEKSNPPLADELKKRMFVFEDITLLDRETVAKVLKEVAEEDLLLAVRATPEEVRSFVWECVPRAEVERLKARLEKLGRTRLRDVEEAQQRIVGVIRRMDDEGKIVVARPEETIG
jgi:flagellar motor switch protein FliM/flagellar motor switch protein FliG